MEIKSKWQADKAQNYINDMIHGAKFVPINDPDFISVQEKIPPYDGFDDVPYFNYCYGSAFGYWSHLGACTYSTDDSGNDILHIGMATDSSTGAVKHYLSSTTTTSSGVDARMFLTDLAVHQNANNVWQDNRAPGYYVAANNFNPFTDLTYERLKIGVRFKVIDTAVQWGLSGYVIDVDDIDTLLSLDKDRYLVWYTETYNWIKNDSGGWYRGYQRESSFTMCYINEHFIVQQSGRKVGTSYIGAGLNLVPQCMFDFLRDGDNALLYGDAMPLRSADTGYNVIGLYHSADSETLDLLCVPGSKQKLASGVTYYCCNDYGTNSHRYVFRSLFDIEQTIKELAYLGLIICPLNDPDTYQHDYIGYVNVNGEATGELLKYAEFKNSDSLQNRYKSMTETPNIPVKPPKPPGPGPDEDEKSTYGGSPWLGWDSVKIDTGLSYREMTSEQMNDFRGVIENLKAYEMAYKQYMRNATASGRIDKDTAHEKWLEVFPTAADYTSYIYDKYGYGGDPVNSIISITAFPFDVPTVTNLPIKDIGAFDLYIDIPWGYTTSGEVEFVRANYYTADGPYGTVHSYPLVTDTSFKINLVNKVITHPNDYADFRAYAPYTRLELYIPMHGTIDLDPAVVLGKRLSVIISVTIADGSSVATVLIDDTIYQTINGQVGYSVPLSVDASSINNLALKTLSAQSQSQRLNAIGNVIHGLASTATSIATGNYGGAIGSTVNTVLNGQQNAINSSALKYQIEHATDGKIVIGQPSSLNAFLVHPNCQLIWHLPLMQHYDSTIYGKTVGYKCYKTTTLSTLTGYTECSNAILDDVSCTEAEKTMILEQLKNGIII